MSYCNSVFKIYLILNAREFILEYDQAVCVHNHYFLTLNTIKGNSMDVTLDNIFSNHLNLMLWNYKNTSVYDHPADSFHVKF